MTDLTKQSDAKDYPFRDELHNAHDTLYSVRALIPRDDNKTFAAIEMATAGLRDLEGLLAGITAALGDAFDHTAGAAASITRIREALAGRQAEIGGLNMELAKRGVQALQSSRLRAAILALPCVPPKGYGDFFAGVATEIYGHALKAAADLVGQSDGVAIGSWSTGEPLPGGVECEICDDTGTAFGKVCSCRGAA